jgi:hypothetical protein
MATLFLLAGKEGVGATDGQQWHIAVIAKITTIGLDLRKRHNTSMENPSPHECWSISHRSGRSLD